MIAGVVERVTGERFDAAMHRLVLAPLALDACFNWGAGCSGAAVRRAVVLYRATGEVARDDLKGQPPACPVYTEAAGCDLAAYRLGDNGALFSPQGGLRISMRDLAKVGRMLARRGEGFLTPRSFAELTGSHWRLEGANGLGEDGTASGFFCDYRLAVHAIGSRAEGCRDDLFADGKFRLGHSGDAYGLRSGLWWSPATGQGIAYFISAVPDDEPKGASGFTVREEQFVRRALAAGQIGNRHREGD